MANAVPLSLEVLACFVLSIALLNRYCDMVSSNIITVVGVFISWFFSFMVIFLLPVDLTSTTYRQCLLDFQSTNGSSTSPIESFSNATSSIPSASLASVTLSPIPQHSTFFQHANSTLDIPQQNSSSLSNITNPCVVPWNYVTSNALTKLWRFIYWTSQFLTWLLLPIMQSFSMAGDFTTIDKLRSAVRANLIYYSSYGAIFTVLLIYVIVRDGLDFANLKVIAISSSNTWGLFLLVILLGYGLVELPRFLINRSRYSQSLNQLYFRISRVNAEKCEAEEKLDDALEEIHQAFAAISNNDTSPLKRYLNQIVDKCPPDWKKRSNVFRRQAAASNAAFDTDRTKAHIYDIKSMARLHRKVIGAVHYHRQISCRWNHLIREVIEWEDIARNQIENNPISARSFKPTLPREQSIINCIYTPRMEWYWKCLLRVWLLRISGYAMAAFSLAVVWSEIAFPISFFSQKLSIFAYFVDEFRVSQDYFYLEVGTELLIGRLSSHRQHRFLTCALNNQPLEQVFSTISIGYLAVCAFYTVFRMKIYNIYYLAPNGQTDEYSLLFSGMLLCRLTAPLCLNYLCLVHRDSHIIKHSKNLETSFTSIMGHLDLIPIVNNGLNVFLPFCISAICLAIYFDFGTHILHGLGFEQFIENDEMTIDWVQTGRELVKREKTKLLRNFDSSTTTYHEMIPPRTQSIDSGPRPITGQNQSAPNFVSEDSPTSLSSSSSGFSRSSLLPKSSQISRENIKPMGQSGREHDHDSSKLEDNIIEIDLESQRRFAKQSGGFFDDV